VGLSLSILVTGAKGFIGKNLVAELKNQGNIGINECDAETTPAELEAYCQAATFVYHLAGVNRPQNNTEFMTGNCGFTAALLAMLQKHNNNCPLVFASSAQAAQDNPYGKSKKAAEDLVLAHGQETGARVLVYRLPNVFGKWCRPNYNSVVATFCHNIARGLPITIHDPSTELNLVYIDDVVTEFVGALHGQAHSLNDYRAVPVTHHISLGALADLLYSFRDSRANLSVPNLSDTLTRKLYATYLSALPESALSFPLKMNSDDRGSFTEFVRTVGQGQFSVNITKPGITKGNHWHHTKNEKFMVVSGHGVIRLRVVGTDAVTSCHVNGDLLQVVEIPPGYTHNIENLGTSDLVTLMWASEPFDKDRPDTYMARV